MDHMSSQVTPVSHQQEPSTPEPITQEAASDMDDLNQLFQDQLLVSQVPSSVWGVLLSLTPDFYDTVLLERTKPQQPTEGSDSATPNFGYHIGRHKSCDVRIANPHISNHHCLLYRVTSNPPRVYLEDTSTNGTFVNGRRVGKTRSVELRDGDEIQLVRYQASKGMTYFPDRFYVFQNLAVHRTEPCLFKQSYLLSDHLGKGAFAEVKVAINRVTGQRFAAKIIDRNKITKVEKRKKMDANFQIETSILSRVRHPAIVQVHGVFREMDKMYLVLDLAADGELFDEIVRREFLGERETRRVMLQLLLAIRHLNRLGVVHRDIKLENILLADKEQFRIKLADFGLAKIVGEQMFMKTVCGTPMYVAPEVLTVRTQGVYDRQVDMWSLGVVLYICLCGFPPFSDELSPPPMRDQIINGMYSFPSPYWDNIPEEAVNLVRQMLDVNPKTRITVEGALAHPWLGARRRGNLWMLANDDEDFVVVDSDTGDTQMTQSVTVESTQQAWSCTSSPLHVNSQNPLPSPGTVKTVVPVDESGIVESGSSRGRKRKVGSFLRSHSDLDVCMTVKRSMHFRRNSSVGDEVDGSLEVFDLSLEKSCAKNHADPPHPDTKLPELRVYHPRPLPRPGAQEEVAKACLVEAGNRTQKVAEKKIT